jgi:hypothetical protein
MSRHFLMTTVTWLVVVAIAGWLVATRWHAASLPGPAIRYSAWRAHHLHEVTDYLAFLGRNRVGSVVPEAQLLRLGRRWQRCGGEEFAVPPTQLWSQIVPTLNLVAELRARGLLQRSQVVSGFRPAAFNRCEGGSQGSRHLVNQALDLDLSSMAPLDIARLCGVWRKEGLRRLWGLGFYSPTQIHLDTAGFRTWGSDFHAGSSLCN